MLEDLSGEWPSGLVAEWTEACVKLFDLGSNPEVEKSSPFR